MDKQAYFDNAATTFPKPEQVYDFADHAFRNIGVNTGRGNYALATGAEEIVQGCRDRLRRLLKCEGKQVVFTASATDALNRILLGLSLKAGDAVYLSPFEHNAVTRTIHHLQKAVEIEIFELPFDRDTLLFDASCAQEMFENHPPVLVCLTHASNVCGAVLPVENIAALAKRAGSIIVIDMSQTAGLVPVRLSLEDIDFAVFAGHKTLYAPFGVGGFICSISESRLRPVLFGGNGVNSIEQDMPSDIRLMEEVGSQNLYAIAGLYASVGWLLEDKNRATAIEHANRDKLLDLLGSYRNIEIVADRMKCERIGVVSCLFDGYSPDEIGVVLNELGVSVRAGLHCAPYAHRFLGTLPAGTVRFSVSALTNETDFEVLERALNYIQQNG